MQPSDIGRLHEITDPRLSPDGRTVAFVLTTVDLEANLYPSAVWMAPVDGSFPVIPFTEGKRRETRPRWSPDGEFIAYVDHPGDSGSRLLVAPVDGNDSVEILEWPEEIEELAWSPDGGQLVFSARDRDEDRYGPEKDRDRPARRIDKLSFRLDNVGWTIDRPRHLYVIAADGSEGAARQLTDGPFQDAGPAWSPDGSTIVFSSARTPDWDRDLATHIYRVPVDGGEPVQLTSGTTTHGSPAWSPDGSHVAYVWGDRHVMPTNGQIGLLDVATGADRLISEGIDLHCAPYLGGAREPLWLDDGRIAFQVDQAGNMPLYAASTTGTAEVLVGGDRHVTGFDAAAGVLAFTAATATRLAEVFAFVDGEERQLTSFGASFDADVPVGQPEYFEATSPDGTKVDAWLIRPDGVGPWPTLFNIHGGPFSQYGNRFHDEFHLQAGAGYAVVYSNPRGSSGHSQAFARAIRGPRAEVDPGTGWGGVDYDDLMAVIDGAIARFPDAIDASRIGVLGGSYGGYMTGWIVGHTDRFKSACIERGCLNLFTFAHTADIGAHFPASYIGASHLDDPDEFARQSPVTYYEAITTPVLLMHSENDLRCPIEQSEDLYVRLKLLDREVEFVRFPGESHELSRSGAPRHRVERIEIILDWFDRTLGL